MTGAPSRAPVTSVLPRNLRSIGNPAVFFGAGNAQGNQLSGTIRVNTSSDDDYIRFVLGFHSGILTGPSDFLLVDWRQSDQGGFFGCVA
ncbi:MAG TPA: hypothetical protein VMM79_02980 [Longimicrobiales bacterium]|nr:hypothetical protein [Longimicrobiales bacterium]